jgi:hypothetical protein
MEVDMSTTIYDASLITQRRMNKAQSGDFLNRIQHATHPQTGYSPALGIYDQSIITTVKNGQIKYYRKQSGCTTVNNGCPCAPIESQNNSGCCGTN